MLINGQSCAIGELTGLKGVTPHTYMYTLFTSTNTFGSGKKTFNKITPSFVVFVQGSSKGYQKKYGNYGLAFKKFIVDNKLGRVVKLSGPNQYYEDKHKVTVYLWRIDHDACQFWWQACREIEINREELEKQQAAKYAEERAAEKLRLENLRSEILAHREKEVESNIMITKEMQVPLNDADLYVYPELLTRAFNNAEAITKSWKMTIPLE